ncbi:hypothetical protein [Microbacterium gorillae]|uniref:hypothetical protein n=1 Tax=Microbacterium gorillae TaxID=1231063 RepID=UPI00058B87F0|nr:hypothetical protein [Microbacterium gorillae]
MSPRTPGILTDARFFIGIGLVAVSIAGVWGVVSAARTTVTFAVAGGALVPGQHLARSDVAEVEAALGARADAYLRPDEIPDDAVLTRTVGAGELIPRDAIGDATTQRTTTVVVSSAVALPSSVEVGTTVDVWASVVSSDERTAPSVLVSDAVVARVGETAAVRGGTDVELVVPRDAVSDVLAATSGEAVISVVPAAGS